MIEGISHITFIVRDLEKAAQFFRDIFDAEEVYSRNKSDSAGAVAKYFLIGQTWIALNKGDPLEKSYNHVAFKISDEEFETYRQRIVKSGVEIQESRPRREGEGASLYFYDYDNHLFELHTGTLAQRLKSYAERTSGLIKDTKYGI